MLSKNFAFNVLTHSYQAKKPGILNIHSTEDVEPLIQSFQQIILQPLRYFYHNFITVISVFVINLHKHIIGNVTGSMPVYIRHIFGIQEEVTEREIYLVKTYGNHIAKYPETAVPDAELDNIKLTSCEDNVDIKSTLSEDEVDYHDGDNADNKEVSASPNNNDSNYKNINSNISNRNRNIDINISRETDDADDESSFNFFEKKLFNENIKKNAISFLHEKTSVTHIFKKLTCGFNSCTFSKSMVLACYVWNLVQSYLTPPGNLRRKASRTLILTSCTDRQYKTNGICFVTSTL